MKVVWTTNAKARLHAIRDYIATDSPHVADGVVLRLVQRSQQLQTAPYSGRSVPEYSRTDVRAQKGQVYYRSIRLRLYSSPAPTTRDGTRAHDPAPAGILRLAQRCRLPHP